MSKTGGGRGTNQYALRGASHAQVQGSVVLDDLAKADDGFERHPASGRNAPIAYTYEADVHCPSCAAARFGLDDQGFVPAGVTDAEGNEPGAVAPWDEWGEPCAGEDQVLVCSDCEAELARW